MLWEGIDYLCRGGVLDMVCAPEGSHVYFFVHCRALQSGCAQEGAANCLYMGACYILL